MNIVRTEDRTPVKRDPNERAWWEGWWESTVCWLELPENEGEEMVQVIRTFSSNAERTAYLKERVEGGYIFDILWVSESIFGGRGHPAVPILSRQEWEDRMAGRD